jgi:tetratricopeptide (TPR) repeat protein
MQGSGLVFCGYGGNDHSIARLIQAAAPDAFPLGIYWVGTAMPTGPVGPALKERPGVFHVSQGDFDALMINVADALGLTLPGFDRWRSLFETYEEALTKQANAAEAADKPQQQKTADRLRTQLDAWKLDADARAVWKSDPDRTEELYRQAIDADPNNATNLGNYAVFLYQVRGDTDRAEELYRRAIDADPNHANNLGNYAQFLFAQRRDNEAIQHVDEALAEPDALAPLRLEIAFYLYAHVPNRQHEAMRQLVSLLTAGERSKGWDFSPNLDRAKQDGDERLPFLTVLADAISEQLPIEELDRFDQWRNASP